MKEEEAKRKVQMRLFQGRCREEAGVVLSSSQGKEPSPGQSLAPAGSGVLGRVGFTPSGPVVPLPSPQIPAPGSTEETGRREDPKQPGFPFSRLWGEEMLQDAEEVTSSAGPRDPPRGAREATAR